MGATTRVSVATPPRGLEKVPPALTDGQQRVLQLQGEGGQGDVLGDRQHGHGGQVGRLVPSIPLAPRGVQSQAPG